MIEGTKEKSETNLQVWKQYNNLLFRTLRKKKRKKESSSQIRPLVIKKK